MKREINLHACAKSIKLMKCEDFVSSHITNAKSKFLMKREINLHACAKSIKSMKCEDFVATGVVTYVEPQNSEAVRDFII